MKNYFLGALLLVAISAKAQERNVLTIDNKPVTEKEFLQIYLKNNPNPQFDKKSIDEYMELFRKFKLKVAEAEALKYDTITKINKELEGYRKQLSTPYMIDSAANKSLVLEAYNRSKTEIRASHILIKCDDTSSPADTLIAYNKIVALRKRIVGGEDFTTVAKSAGGSQDPSVSTNGGDLGYFTVFQMVFPFEEAAYNTAVGQVSTIVRTRFGYHILKVVDKRDARGTIETAHIMIAVPKEATEDDKKAAEKKIGEIYDLIGQGQKFEDLAKIHSDDPSSMTKGGVLPAFGSGTNTRMVLEFENAAFALQADNEVSRPVKTQYGWHIIKRLKLKPIQPFETVQKELQKNVNKDERAAKTQDFFITKLKKEYGYKFKGRKSLKWFKNNIDSTYFNGTWNTSKLTTNKLLFTIDGKKYNQKEFGDYLVKNHRNVRKMSPDEVVAFQYKAFEKSSILAYEESKLETKYPEFKALMKEYHDGVLLFEVMTDKVWGKATKDTAGLRTFFEENKTKYQWKERLNSTVYECTNKATAMEVEKMLRSSDTITSKHVTEKINKESELNLKVKTNRFETETTAYLKDRNLKKGINTIYEYEGKFYVVKVDEILPAGGKTFNESKGPLVSDYQNKLELDWLNELSLKHKIEINEDVLYNLKH